MPEFKHDLVAAECSREGGDVQASLGAIVEARWKRCGQGGWRSSRSSNSWAIQRPVEVPRAKDGFKLNETRRRHGNDFRKKSLLHAARGARSITAAITPKTRTDMACSQVPPVAVLLNTSTFVATMRGTILAIADTIPASSRR